MRHVSDLHVQETAENEKAIAMDGISVKSYGERVIMKYAWKLSSRVETTTLVLLLSITLSVNAQAPAPVLRSSVASVKAAARQSLSKELASPRELVNHTIGAAKLPAQREQSQVRKVDVAPQRTSTMDELMARMAAANASQAPVQAQASSPNWPVARVKTRLHQASGAVKAKRVSTSTVLKSPKARASSASVAPQSSTVSELMSRMTAANQARLQTNKELPSTHLPQTPVARESTVIREKSNAVKAKPISTSSVLKATKPRIAKSLEIGSPFVQKAAPRVPQSAVLKPQPTSTRTNTKASTGSTRVRLAMKPRPEPMLVAPPVSRSTTLVNRKRTKPAGSPKLATPKLGTPKRVTSKVATQERGTQKLATPKLATQKLAAKSIDKRWDATTAMPRVAAGAPSIPAPRMDIPTSNLHGESGGFPGPRRLLNELAQVRPMRVAIRPPVPAEIQTASGLHSTIHDFTTVGTQEPGLFAHQNANGWSNANDWPCAACGKGLCRCDAVHWSAELGAVFLSRSRADGFSDRFLMNEVGGGNGVRDENIGLGFRGAPRVRLARDRSIGCDLEAIFYSVGDWKGSATSNGDLVVRGVDAIGNGQATTVYESELTNFEFNLASNWDNWTKVMVGFRWMELEEFASINAVTDLNSNFRQATNINNRMIGMQVGVEKTLWDRGGYLQFDSAMKFGGFANNIDRDTAGFGVSPLDDTVASFLAELDLSMDYEITPTWSLTAGYQFLWLTDVGQGIEQFFSENEIVESSSVFYHGFRFGIERTW